MTLIVAATGCGAYSYAGSAITRTSAVKAPTGHPIDGGDVSTNVYSLDIGVVKYFGPFFVDGGAWSAGDFLSVRDADGMAVTREGHPASVLYIGGGFRFHDHRRTFGALYVRGGINVLGGNNSTNRMYEAGFEFCPTQTGRKVKLNWCGRLGLLVQSGIPIPDGIDPVGEYTSFGPAASFGVRWEGPR